MVEPSSASISPSQDDKNWALGAHLGPLLLGFIAPLIVMLTRGKESPFVRQHAVEALNFQITVTAAVIISLVLTLVVIGACLLAAVGIAALVFAILAAVKAYAGEPYRYPVSIRLIK